jgi:hypothetical protein
VRFLVGPQSQNSKTEIEQSMWESKAQGVANRHTVKRTNSFAISPCLGADEEAENKERSRSSL